MSSKVSDQPVRPDSLINKYLEIITKTSLFKYIENFTSKNWKNFTSKNWKISDKKNNSDIHISAQNIDCRYSLDPSRRGGSNEYP